MNPSIRNRVLGAGGLLGLGLVALVAFRGCSGADQSAGERAKAADAVPSVALPEFSSPEQRRAYLDSVQAGEQKSLDLINDALAQARAVGSADPSYLAELERVRAERTARLEAYRARAK